jgi:ubiquitin-protein ligase
MNQVLVEKAQNEDYIDYDLVMNDSDNNIIKLRFLKNNNIYLVDDINNENNLYLINMVNPSKKELVDLFEKKDNEKNMIENIYNLNRTVIFNKFYIDFDKIFNSITFDKNIKNIKNVKNVNNENTFDPKMIFEIIKKDIISINQDSNYKHYVKLDSNINSNNISSYNLELVLVYDIDNKITKKLKEFKTDNITFQLILDKTYYPFKAPDLKIKTNIFKNNFVFHLNNLKEFKQTNWNPLISVKYIIEKLGEQMEKVCYDYLGVEDNNEFNNLVLELASLTGEVDEQNLINLEFEKVNFVKEKSRWNAGTGYGHEGLSSWDIKKFTKEKEDINSRIEYILVLINGLITEENKEIVNNDILKNYILKSISGINLLELQEKSSLYTEIFKGLEKLFTLNIITINDIKKISGLVDIINDLKDSIAQLLGNIEMENNDVFLLKVNDILNMISNNIHIDIINDKSIININDNIHSDNLNNYITMVKKYMFTDYEIPSYYTDFKDSGKLSKQSMVRIMSEIQGFKKNLPVDWDTSILFRYSKKNIQSCSFYIIGPKDTPYHNGIFEFNLFFPYNYPNEAPKVLLLTTGGGTVRFNPNLYNCGKVCLSLLGTWSGQDGEKWNPKISTALQVLISIQSLIFIEEPYFNEPGYERDRNNDRGRKNSKDYNEIRRVETIRWAINDKLKNPPETIKDFVVEHFKMKKEELINVTNKWLEEAVLNKEKLSQVRNEMLVLLENLK